jgi:hypothetical protein
MQVYVPRGWDYREITVRCGNTSPTGEPYLCGDCAKRHAGRDWRREAIEAGEQWEEEPTP